MAMSLCLGRRQWTFPPLPWSVEVAIDHPPQQGKAQKDEYFQGSHWRDQRMPSIQQAYGDNRTYKRAESGACRFPPAVVHIGPPVQMPFASTGLHAPVVMVKYMCLIGEAKLILRVP